VRAGARPLHNAIDDHNQRIQLLSHFGQPQVGIRLPGLYADHEPHARLDELRDCVHSLVQPGFGALDSRFPFFVPFSELGFETFITLSELSVEAFVLFLPRGFDTFITGLKLGVQARPNLGCNVPVTDS